MYTASYTTYITYYSMVSIRHFNYVTYIWYVEGYKFSTSTHINYQIVQNIISAICGYFYGSWGPSGRSEIVYTVKKVEKTDNPIRGGHLVTYFRDISRKNVTLDTGSHELCNCSTFLTIQTFFARPGLQEVSGSHKNIHRQLRRCVTRSDNLREQKWKIYSLLHRIYKPLS